PARHRPGARSARREGRAHTKGRPHHPRGRFPMWLRSFLKSLKSSPSVATIRRSPQRPRTPRLGVEALDDRCLPSTFTVTNLLDSGTGSLRAAVAAANASPGADAIDFATTGT